MMKKFDNECMLKLMNNVICLSMLTSDVKLERTGAMFDKRIIIAVHESANRENTNKIAKTTAIRVNLTSNLLSRLTDVDMNSA